MDPSLTWIDLTARDREQMRRVLDLFSEQGTLDEMGLGSLRDALADALFLDTSSIQTRLSYTLLVPWFYRRLEPRHDGGDVAQVAQRGELDLIGALLKGGDTVGVIGAAARDGLARLPSSVCWACLVRWGIFVPSQSHAWYHTHFDSLARQREALRQADDPSVVCSAPGSGTRCRLRRRRGDGCVARRARNR